MRHSILLMVLAIVLVSSWDVAASKGRGGGGGQGHGARSRASGTPPSSASRNHYGNRGGHRGYGNRNSMMNNRTMRLSRLVRDLNTLTVGHAASPNDRNILRNDLMGVAQGGSRPPSPAVQQLSGGLISHLPNRRTPSLNTQRLALDLEAVMNGSRLPAARVNQAISSAQAILRSSGVPQAGIQALGADLRAIGFSRVAGNQPGLAR